MRKKTWGSVLFLIMIFTNQPEMKKIKRESEVDIFSIEIQRMHDRNTIRRIGSDYERMK